MTAFLIWVLLSKESGSAQATLCRGLLLCFHSVDNGLLYWEDSSLLSFAALATTLLLPHSFPAITCHPGHWRCILHHVVQCCLLILTFLILFNETLKILGFLRFRWAFWGSSIVLPVLQKVFLLNKKLECKYETNENGKKHLTLKWWL